MNIILKYLYFILNSFLLIINIKYIISNKGKASQKYYYFKEKKLFKFKNSDKFLLNLIKNKYQDISNYLNNKYYNKFKIFVKSKLLSLGFFDKEWINKNLMNSIFKKKKNNIFI